MKRLLFILFCFVAIFNSHSQTQIGDGIYDIGVNHFGFSVSMPSENVIAIGAPKSSGSSSGRVKIFEYNGSDWLQKGNDITGDAYDLLGYSISMGDENTITIGAPTQEVFTFTNYSRVLVYKFDGLQWNLIHEQNIQEEPYGAAGKHVSMPDTSTFAYTAPGSNYNRATVKHKLPNTNYFTTKGGDLSINGSGYLYAAEMGDSDNIAIARTSNVQAYSWNGVSWIPKGSALSASTLPMITMPDSNTIGVSSFFGDSVSIYTWDGSSWIQKGISIGDDDLSGFGSSISMPNSNTIAIGAYKNDNLGGEDAGRVSVYKWDGTSWIQFGNDIDGTIPNGQSGIVSMPNDRFIGVGTQFTNYSFQQQPDIGLVRVFGIQGVYGSIFDDLQVNCLKDSLEAGISGMNLIVNPGNIVTSTNSKGVWHIDSLGPGTYSVSVDTTKSWDTDCSTTQNFIVNSLNNYTQGPDFGMINTNPCTDPDVSIFAPSLRRCFSNRLVYVSACNQITATGILDSSYVDVELDPLLMVDGASLPYTDLGNNTFRFETGDIYPGQCVNFTLSTTVSCDAQNGQTLCMDATLYPAEDCIFDSIPSDPITNDGIGGTLDGLPGPCTLPWDKSSLQVDGWCQGDSVYFSVTNTGDFGDGDMECYSPVWLTVDGVVTDTDSLQIQGGETVIYSYPASGQTFFLNAEQHPLHPGNSHPNAHVELCGDSTNWTPGVVNQLPQDDADPDVDIYCGQVTAPVDPNDKTGYPLGQTEEYYIQPNQQLQYVIRFQNVGTDTAFTVVVRDTLDIDLNIFTVTPGVSSHPYTFKMYGPRVLEWTFEDIQLPDSTTNSEGSNGFLTFHVDQVPDLAPGTVINNDADIYFDFELPITTNTTVHKIFDGFVSVLNVEDLTIEGKDLLIYPNPTSNLITIQSESPMNNKFKIFDQQGREVIKGKLTGKNTEVSLGKLSRGSYTIQVDGNYKPAVIVKE